MSRAETSGIAAFSGFTSPRSTKPGSEPMAPARNVVPERGLPKTKTSRSSRRPNDGRPGQRRSLDRARVEGQRAHATTLRCAAYALDPHRARRARSSPGSVPPCGSSSSPTEDEAGKADAVVVLSGSKHERLDRGLELVREGVAPVLVISDGFDPRQPRANRLCHDGGDGFSVVCFTPDPDSTRGEARKVAELAREHGWKRVLRRDVALPRHARAHALRPLHRRATSTRSASTIRGRACPRRSPANG